MHARSSESPRVVAGIFSRRSSAAVIQQQIYNPTNGSQTRHKRGHARPRHGQEHAREGSFRATSTEMWHTHAHTLSPSLSNGRERPAFPSCRDASDVRRRLADRLRVLGLGGVCVIGANVVPRSGVSVCRSDRWRWERRVTGRYLALVSTRVHLSALCVGGYQYSVEGTHPHSNQYAESDMGQPACVVGLIHIAC